MRWARTRTSTEEQTGVADAGMGHYFCETVSIANILEFGKDLSKNRTSPSWPGLTWLDPAIYGNAELCVQASDIII